LHLYLNLIFVSPELKKKVLGADGVAQVVVSLPSKCEALSSNPNTSKKCLKLNAGFERLLNTDWLCLATGLVRSVIISTHP
jgi:hypothetical protein